MKNLFLHEKIQWRMSEQSFMKSCAVNYDLKFKYSMRNSVILVLSLF